MDWRLCWLFGYKGLPFLINLGWIIVYSISGNYRAVFWLVIAEPLVALDFHLVYVNWKDRLSHWHSKKTFTFLKVLYIVGILSGLVATVYYIFTLLYYHLSVLPMADSNLFPAISSFVMFLSSLGLFGTCRSLSSEL